MKTFKEFYNLATSIPRNQMALYCTCFDSGKLYGLKKVYTEQKIEYKEEYVIQLSEEAYDRVVQDIPNRFKFSPDLRNYYLFERFAPEEVKKAIQINN